MAHDLPDESSPKPKGKPSRWSGHKTLQIDIDSGSDTLSNVIWIPPGLVGAMLESGTSTNDLTCAFLVCYTYGGTYLPVVRDYALSQSDGVGVQNPVPVTISQAASVKNVSDLLCPGGFYLRLQASASEGTADLLCYLHIWCG